MKGIREGISILSLERWAAPATLVALFEGGIITMLEHSPAPVQLHAIL
jgi:hypothetical protein